MNRYKVVLIGVTSFFVLAISAVETASSANSARSPTREISEIPGARTEIYKTAGAVELPIYIFEPADHKPTHRAPTIIFFFGGGWVSGTPRQFEQHCRYLASRGMVAMTADYRVFNRHGTLAVKCVEDAKSAIRWVRSNADRLGIDAKRIAAGGGSAGGHIAACSALIEGFDAEKEDLGISSVPQALVLFNPALLLAELPGVKTVKPGRLENLEKRLGTKPEKLSPTHHVRKGAPPCLILHGKADDTVPFETVEAFAAAMHKAGNRCDLIGYEGQEHSFFNYARSIPNFSATLKEADKFLVSLGWLSGSESVDAFVKSAPRKR